MEFGQLYRSAAVLDAGNELPQALRPDEWAGQPGTRAPHLWVESNGKRHSILDLFQPDWVLLTGDPSWRALAIEVGRRQNLSVVCVVEGEDFVVSDPVILGATFGLNTEGASLIRPDGFIAWRAVDMPAYPADALSRALEAVACITPNQELSR